jgi:hypothetical protein
MSLAFNSRPLLQITAFGFSSQSLFPSLNPYKAQKMSEDNKSTLAYVFERWANIQTHLSKFANSGSSFAHDLKQFMAHEDGKLWKARRDRQVMPIHVAAFFLQPHNFDAYITQHSQDQIYNILRQHIPDHEKALRQFLQFRDRRGPFNTGNQAWKFKDPSLFWSYMKATCPELASFAEKLMITCVNSVTSERAWSAINFIDSKSRNRLSLESVDKLVFIFMNVRPLRKLNNYDPSADELLAMEDKLMGWI